MSGSLYRVQRVGRHARGLAATLEGDEPRTSRIVSELVAARSTRWRRAWQVVDPCGESLAVVVLSRACFDRWSAACYLRDASAAPTVAGLLDRSIAWSVSGAAVDVRPLLPHLHRVRRVLVAPWFIVPHPVPDVLGPPDDRTRLATMLDLDALVELYSGYEIAGPSTRWQLRQYLRHALDHDLVIVYETHGRIVGALVLESRTRRFATLTDLTVEPDFRRSGVAWELVKRARAVTAGMGLGACGALAASNPMHRDGITWDDAHNYNVWLGEPHRFKGQTRLRRVYRRLQPLRPRAAATFRDPADPARPPS